MQRKKGFPELSTPKLRQRKYANTLVLCLQTGKGALDKKPLECEVDLAAASHSKHLSGPALPQRLRETRKNHPELTTEKP
eukprot:2851093-Amphidinium_carterae.2